MKDLFRKFIKSVILLQRPTNRAALRHGVGGSIEHDAVLKAFPCDLVVDVGANRGQFSLAARHFNPHARIIAFEPLASAAAVYERIFADDPRVQLHRSAVGPSEGTATMQRSGREDSSSLLPIGDVMPNLYPGTQAVGKEEVAIASLTAFLSPADFTGRAMLKIDVQGYELEVLKSAKPLLPFFQYAYLEASFVSFYDGQVLADELVAYLQAHGFSFSGMINPGFHPKTGLAVQVDMLFINRAALIS